MLRPLGYDPYSIACTCRTARSGDSSVPTLNGRCSDCSCILLSSVRCDGHDRRHRRTALSEISGSRTAYGFLLSEGGVQQHIPKDMHDDGLVEMLCQHMIWFPFCVCRFDICSGELYSVPGPLLCGNVLRVPGPLCVRLALSPCGGENTARLMPRAEVRTVNRPCAATTAPKGGHPTVQSFV